MATTSVTDRDRLERFASELRRRVVTTIGNAGLGHVGGDLSVADILAVLFCDVLRLDPADPSWPDRDRFVMSKGHAAVSLYTVLAMRGFIDEHELSTFAQPLSRLSGHPNRVKVPGVETNTGPLGHGFPVAVGMAIGASLGDSNWRTFVIVGDGELQEGSNWEAAMLAGHRGLSNLVLIVDRNHLQQGGRTEETNGLDPLDDKFRAFGWSVAEVDGHDVEALSAALSSTHAKPLAIIARTVKGRGVSFMENLPAWHHKVPTPEQVSAALEELGR